MEIGIENVRGKKWRATSSRKSDFANVFPFRYIAINTKRITSSKNSSTSHNTRRQKTKQIFFFNKSRTELEIAVIYRIVPNDICYCNINTHNVFKPAILNMIQTLFFILFIWFDISVFRSDDCIVCCHGGKI